jgi:hypothetical protein
MLLSLLVSKPRRTLQTFGALTTVPHNSRVRPLCAKIHWTRSAKCRPPSVLTSVRRSSEGELQRHKQSVAHTLSRCMPVQIFAGRSQPLRLCLWKRIVVACVDSFHFLEHLGPRMSEVCYAVRQSRTARRQQERKKTKCILIHFAPSP